MLNWRALWQFPRMSVSLARLKLVLLGNAMAKQLIVLELAPQT